MRPPLLFGLVLAVSAHGQARPPLRLVLEHTIDESSGISFGTLQRLELGPDGGLIAVDGANNVLYRFTPAGKLRDSLGRKGQGPGEFMIANGLGIGPAGEVAIADLRTRRITFWAPDGTLQGSTQLTAMPVDLLWRVAEPLLGVMSFAPATVMLRFGPTRLGREELAGEVAAFPDPKIAEYPTAISCGMCRRALTPGGALLAAAPDTFYRISEFDRSGKVVRTWTREAGAGIRTAEEVEALRQRLAAGPGGGRPLPGMESRFRAPDADALRFRPRFQSIGMDDAGRLLALVNVAGQPNPVLDVFATDGRFLGTVAPDHPLQSFTVRGHRLAAVSEDKDGIPVILIYRIESP